MNTDQETRVGDAISFIVAMTPKEIADRAGVPVAVALKVLKSDPYFIECRDKHYRYANSTEWVVLNPKKPIPKSDVKYALTPIQGGYEVSYPARTVRPVRVKVTVTGPIKETPTPTAPVITEGQLSIFSQL